MRDRCLLVIKLSNLPTGSQNIKKDWYWYITVGLKNTKKSKNPPANHQLVAVSFMKTVNSLRVLR
jgi:hypothetical protein